MTKEILDNPESGRTDRPICSKADVSVPLRLNRVYPWEKIVVAAFIKLLLSNESIFHASTAEKVNYLEQRVCMNEKITLVWTHN